ncbi:MAG: hypothetical protein CFE23_08780 [Flavobacterium sp. BFFFF1]|uniref:YncE family protein n=1 Tax=unclassified Flavobacterium TaxID=196869 RepID=UPI000BCE40E5|nr:MULTISPECIES: DUF5074 domain-containing protein [unclassified Flavobacterium]OYU80568.1 MAG: hypothetical protein CFE23_08780 [Flavobacterium sp. BFFFF1]
MKFTKLFFTAVAVSIVLASCDDTGNSTPLGAYENGVLVVNEGNGTAGSITYIGNDRTTIQQDVYGAENAGDGIGGYVQSIFFNGDEAYIISNGSNKITIVNRYTFKVIDKIETGLSVPRYGVVADGKAYVTNLASFGSLTDDFITVINTNTHEIESTFPVNAIADRIFSQNGKLYVGNGNYGEGHSVTVMNAANGAILQTLETTLSPTSLAESDGILYVLCSNYTDPSTVVKIDLTTNQIVGTINLASSMVNAQNLDIENGKLYFTVNSAVYAAPLSAATISDAPLFTADALTLYGFAVENDRIYISDAKDYASDGKALIYSLTGTLENQYTVGLIPNGFYFN